jgi:hypothetical protein
MTLTIIATSVTDARVHSQNQDLAPVLKGLLQKYQGCILERYETKDTQNLAPRDDATCLAGNKCSLAYRRATLGRLQAQANLGDPTNFETLLESAIINDCFDCQKHAKWHTKHVHCTMECGGNNGVFAGPCFEGCKAGVDITKLVNDIINDIKGVLHSLGLVGPDDSNAPGGVSVATNHKIVDPGPAENCDSTANGYYIAPAAMLDWAPTSAPPFKQTLTNYAPPSAPTRDKYKTGSLQNIGANEGRLRSDLRAAAARANPIDNLCHAAAAFAHGDLSDGNAFADLSVTGRRAFEAFRAHPPQVSDILPCLQTNPNTQPLSEAVLERAISQALDRAYRVVTVLRAGGWPVAGRSRPPLGYIAVSGEDDQPHRPVNVPSAEFPQYDLAVSVKRPGGGTLTVHTRYMIAHTVPPQTSHRPTDTIELDRIDPHGLERTVPADRIPVLASNAEVILYIHGMDSRLEEALDLTRELIRIGKQNGKNYTVISLDLPTSGYADNLDYNLIAPLNADGHADGVEGLGFAPNKYVVPVVDFIENFIVSFVNTLNRSIPITSHLRAIVGGSLGGNMSMRLGRPRADAPWVTGVVPWSPAAIWPSFADDGTKHAGLAVPWAFAGGDPSFLPETLGARRSFFYGGFDWQSKAAFIIPLGGGKPQAEYWYDDLWKCKGVQMRLSRIDRYETYNRNFRLWHWRLGMEQLLFSQQIPKPGSNQPLYLSNTIRTLLLCGMDDKGGDLCENTRQVAAKMSYTPGYALFLKNTGHSIHNERPNYLGNRIAEFIESATTKPPAGRSDTIEGNKDRLAEVTTTVSVTVSRIGSESPGVAQRAGLYRSYARIKILDGTYAKGNQVWTFSKSAPILMGQVPIRIEIWRESAPPQKTSIPGRRPSVNDSAERARLASGPLRVLEVLYDPKKRVLSARDISGDALSSRYGSKSVTSRAGVDVVFAANGDAPEVVFIVNDVPNR